MPGLCAAGDCSLLSSGSSVASAMGAIAGRGAVAFAQRVERRDPDPGSPSNALERMSEPLRATAGGRWQDLEDEVRAVVTDDAGCGTRTPAFAAPAPGWPSSLRWRRG